MYFSIDSRYVSHQTPLLTFSYFFSSHLPTIHKLFTYINPTKAISRVMSPPQEQCPYSVKIKIILLETEAVAATVEYLSEKEKIVSIIYKDKIAVVTVVLTDGSKSEIKYYKDTLYIMGVTLQKPYKSGKPDGHSGYCQLTCTGFLSFFCSEWEGFKVGTKAVAIDGATTIIDILL